MASDVLSVLELIEAIEQLTPSQRRQLQRRLYASGLFVPEVLLTDQNRLVTAPALGNTFLQQRARRSSSAKPKRGTTFVAGNSPSAGVPPTDVSTTGSTITANPQANRPSSPNAPYRSPISGSIVLGTPVNSTAESDPHLMTPLPGQAPERPIGIIIDAGSFILRWPGEAPHRVRLNFNTRVSEHDAHYDTLIHVLEVVERRLRDSQADPRGARLDIRSDNEEFLRQARGELPIAEISTQIRNKKLQTQVRHFGSWRFGR